MSEEMIGMGNRSDAESDVAVSASFGRMSE
jgi:hypothetical protein